MPNTMLYKPADSFALDAVDKVELLAAYCLDLEMRGNTGAEEENPPCDWDTYKDIVFYERRGRRKRDSYKVFWLYRNWRQKWVIKYPEYTLIDPPRQKPKESITERAIRDLLRDYVAAYRWIFKGRDFGDFEFTWYGGQYHLKYPSPSLEKCTALWQGPTRRAAREFLYQQFEALQVIRPDYFLFRIWKKMFGKMRKSDIYLHYLEKTDHVQLSAASFTGGDAPPCALSFPNAAAAQAWFEAQIEVLKAWGIKPPKKPY